MEQTAGRPRFFVKVCMNLTNDRAAAHPETLGILECGPCEEEGMDIFIKYVLIPVVTGVVAVVIAFFVKDPVRRWLEKRRELGQHTRSRISVEIHQVFTRTPGSDYAGLITGQNSEQNLFSFAVPMWIVEPSSGDLRSFREADGKLGFMKAVAGLLTNAQKGGKYDVYAPLPGGRIDTPKQLVVTDIPIPGNYYAWNTPNRELLVISTASVEPFFGGVDQHSISDFVETMLVRMAVFSVVSQLDPSADHLDSSVGCLFDFTIELKRTQAVVSKPFICHDCQGRIASCCGVDFSLEVRKWVDSKRKNA